MLSPSCVSACLGASLGFCLVTSLNASADVVTLNPIADTSLIQVAPDNNLGGAQFFNAGTAGNGNRNRGLMSFALSEAIPAGSVIDSVSLSLDVVREPSVDIQPATFGLHRVFVSWGEGSEVPADEGSPGQGAPAVTGEATWMYRFVGGPAWTLPGGLAGTDFAAAPSSTTFIYGIGDEVIFESSDDLRKDVQDWVDHPGTNFGWMLITENELLRKSARGFASREDPAGGPLLTISFTPVPEPAVGGLIAAGASIVLLCRRPGNRPARRAIPAAR